MGFVGMQLVNSIENVSEDYQILLEQTNSLLNKIKKNVGFYDYKHNIIK